MIAIAFFNDQGGAGKTTLVQDLAWTYADHISVSVVDMHYHPHCVPPPACGTQGGAMSVAAHNERSTRGRTATDRALTAIETLLAESGRTALLRREALAVGPSAGAVDRALRRLRSQGRIRRYGAGIYGVGGAKVFQAAPEALERLGYRVLSPEPARNWSARRNGSVLRLDRPCHRQIRGHGVRMNFETRSGRLLPSARPPMTRTEEFPTTAETEAHYESFHWCQSYARAEKDLCVAKALDAVESFNTSHAQLALDGGTCLSAYHRLLRRFSEDIDLRIRPSPAAVESIGRVEALKAAGAAFRDHVAEALPWLALTRKGRVRRDGVVQSFIFQYESRLSDPSVAPGIKFELVGVPWVCTLRERRRTAGVRAMPTVAPVEIAAGKWAALARKIPDGSWRTAPDLVRHAHDLAELLTPIEEAGKGHQGLAEVFDHHDIEHARVRQAFDVLSSRAEFADLYTDYTQRMGTEKIGSGPLDHLPWDSVLERMGQGARIAGLLQDESPE